jgi:hypothetical protein
VRTPPRCVPSRSTAELGTLDAGDAVIASEFFVEERVTAVQEVDDAASVVSRFWKNSSVSRFIDSRK